jgi:transposase
VPQEKRECPRCRDLEARIEALERQLAEQRRQIGRLTELLEEERRKNRRQAAPFSKGEPKQEPGRPGRKPGGSYGRQAIREIPRRVDERVTVPCPLFCPDCGGAVRLEGKATQYQIDLPKVCATATAFEVHVGRCQGCGRRVQGRDRRQVSDALGMGRVHFGANVVSWAGCLNKTLGLSYGKIQRLFSDMFGLELERSTLTRALGRLAQKAEPTYEELKRQLRESLEIYPDETGWRQGGHPAWLHTATSRDTTVYLIARGRGFAEAAELIGGDFDGVIGSDGWAPYWKFPQAAHQTCNAHLLRRCNQMLETATGGARRFPAAVKSLLKKGLALRDRLAEGQISEHGLTIARGRLERDLDRLLSGRPMPHPDNQRLANHLRHSRHDILFYLYYPHVEATNWPAEQAIRPAVVNRKNSGGNRTARGSRTQAVLMSLLRTCQLRNVSPLKTLSQILRDPIPRARLPLAHPT